jgi:hypothetical protein
LAKDPVEVRILSLQPIFYYQNNLLSLNITNTPQMKKLIERLKAYRKKREIKNFRNEQDEWLGAEARVVFSKEDEKSLKQKRRKR